MVKVLAINRSRELTVEDDNTLFSTANIGTANSAEVDLVLPEAVDGLEIGFLVRDDQAIIVSCAAALRVQWQGVSIEKLRSGVAGSQVWFVAVEDLWYPRSVEGDWEVIA